MKLERKLMVVGCCIMLISLGLSALATRTITDSSDTVLSSITTSAGGVYAATFAGLQSAIYSLNGTGGKVTLPTCNISVTTPLLMTSNVWLCGSGEKSVISQGVNANVTLIQNYGYVNRGVAGLIGQNHMRISDLTLYGNEYRNPRFADLSGNGRGQWAMRFSWGNYSSFENIIVKDCYICFSFNTCNDVQVSKCRFYNTGMNYTGWTPVPVGNEAIPYCIWFKGGYNCTVSCCDMYNNYCGGIALEGGLIAGVTTPSSTNCLIDTCSVYGGQMGYYTENCYNTTFSNCIAKNIVNTEPYHASNQKKPYGFLIGASSYGVKMIGCKILNCGNPSGLNGSGAYLGGSNNTIDSCEFNKIYGNGTYIAGSDNTIQNSILRSCSYYGIWYTSSGSNPIQKMVIQNNKIFYTVKTGIYIGLGNYGYKELYGKVDNNLIIAGHVTTSTYGIYNRGSNLSVCGNTIDGYYDGIYSYGGERCLYNNNHITGAGNIGIYLIAVSGRGGCNNTVNNNIIDKCTNDGILQEGNNTVFANNIITRCTDGIQIGLDIPSRNNTLIGNIIKRCTKGINEVAGYGDYTKILCNDCTSCTTPIDVAGTNTTWFCSAARFYGFNSGTIS
jgi:hypothetical protein